MCDAISLSTTQLPARYFELPAIVARFMRRGENDVQEVQFRYRGKPSPALLPVILHEEFRIVRWGNQQRRSRHLPAQGVVSVADLEKPPWTHLSPWPVLVPAQALLHRSVWITVIEGIEGVCVSDEHGTPTAYMLTEPSTDYYQIMTKCGMMPKLVGEVI